MKKLQQWGVLDRQLTPSERWMTFAMILLVAVLAALNMFKASPAIQYIASDISMPKNMISQIMGAYSIPAVVFAYIGMWLGQKLGFKFSALISVILMACGTITCLFVTDPNMFLAGRIFEGCGYGIIAVVGPNAIPRIFPQKNIPLSMGIWSQWITFGTVVSFIFAPMLFNLGGGVQVPFSWHAIWIAAVVIEVITAILVVLFIKMPAVNENTIVEGDVNKKLVKGKNFMGGAIAVSVAFVVFAYLNVVAFNTMYPSFLQQTKGLDVSLSSWMTMIASILGAIIGIFCGVIAAKRHWRKSFIVIGYIVWAVIAFFCLWTPGNDMIGPWIGVIVYGIPLGFVPTCTRALIPRLVVDSKQLDFALSTMGFLMALGKVLGGYFVSPTIMAVGYTGMAQYTLAPMCIVAAIIVILFVKSDKYLDELRAKEQQESLEEDAKAVN